jgi:hypothetical protein
MPDNVIRVYVNPVMIVVFEGVEERTIAFVFGNGKERKLNVEAEWKIGLLKRVILEVFSALLEGCLEGDIVL